jgi:hypothetical protein
VGVEPLAKPGGGPQLLGLWAWLLLGSDPWLLLLLLLAQPLQVPLTAGAVLLCWLLTMPK